MYSPRTAAINFISELVRKRGKENLQKFLGFIVEVFRRYQDLNLMSGSWIYLCLHRMDDVQIQSWFRVTSVYCYCGNDIVSSHL